MSLWLLLAVEAAAAAAAARRALHPPRVRCIVRRIVAFDQLPIGRRKRLESTSLRLREIGTKTFRVCPMLSR